MPPRVRRAFEYAAARLLAPAGYELRDRVLSERPEGFPGYLEASRRAGMDVNDYTEQALGWKLPQPTLEQVLFPYLEPDSRVCEIGPGTGRWSRHIVPRIPRGELHLVDRSPWIARFLRAYFAGSPNVQAHVGDGQTLPFAETGWLDVVFSANTFVALKLGVVYHYVRDCSRVLRPGGYSVFDYVDPTTEEGWQHLLSQGAEMAEVYTFHAPEAINRVLWCVGFEVIKRYQVGKSMFVVARRGPNA